MNEAVLCSKCGEEPRYPGQRWGPACATRYSRERRARLLQQKPRESGIKLSQLPDLLVLNEMDRKTFTAYVRDIDTLRWLVRLGLDCVRKSGLAR